MQSKEIDDLLSFAGRSSKECEDFISKVTKAAYQECFLRDRERVAALAAAGLEGKALRWYESLPRTSTARTDWERLRQYMLYQWSSETESDVEDPPPSYASTLTEKSPNPVSTAPIPLSSKTSTSQPRGGVVAIMLEGEDKPSVACFISPPAHGQGHFATGSSWLDVSFRSGTDNPKFKKLELVGGPPGAKSHDWKYLAVAEFEAMNSDSSVGWGLLCAVNKDDHGGFSSMGKRQVQHEVWTLQPDGSVTLTWQTSQKTSASEKQTGLTLHPVVDLNSDDIYFACNPDMFIAKHSKNGTRLSKARLVFHPAQKVTSA
ncbi:hypothetical protein FRC04_001062 [Tulasnella sp. 424]|nr:hypothetical protein FRC04_001062 [Tulasnella sp. 424]